MRYYTFSTIHHSVRGMPMLTASNIDGNRDQDIPRKEKANESDIWYTDPRILADEQTGNAFYRGSGFDRGHMVRREEAGWGKDKASAKKANDDTFHFTNCCPQHKNLNQKIWAALEEYILNSEKGKMRQLKMNVYTGPIFDDENDRSIRGVQIPMNFYKIVAWLREGELAATGFVMGQEEFTRDMAWEEFDFSDSFKTDQRSIKEIAELAHIDFGILAEKDTFKKINKDSAKPRRLNSVEDILI